MVKIKPKVEIKETVELLKQFNIEVDDINEVTDGQIARTFNFSSNKKEYFIQFNQGNMSQGTINEILFRDDFSTRGIPLRNTVSYGDYLDYKYVITEKTVGIAFDKLKDDEFDKLLLPIISTLKKIAETDISKYSEYGWLDENGNGKFESWISHLEFVKEEEPGWFYDNWHTLFETTFLERDKFDFYYNKMTELFKFIPDIRQLIHSGYCGGNILFKDCKISAILDWQDARYGDPVYDLAYTTFWMDKEQTIKFTNNYIEEFKIDIAKDNLYERIKCYQYYIGLDSMRFAAKIENKEFYDYIIWLLSEI